jgi:hypothetical protein
VPESAISLLLFEIKEMKLENKEDDDDDEENVCNNSQVIVKITLRVDKKVV